jgi:hypothetical protein
VDRDSAIEKISILPLEIMPFAATPWMEGLDESTTDGAVRTASLSPLEPPQATRDRQEIRNATALSPFIYNSNMNDSCSKEEEKAAYYF